MNVYFKQNQPHPLHRYPFKMTSTPNYVKEIMACLPPTMIDKLEYACKAYTQELLIRKKDEDNKGNKKLYSWLNKYTAAVIPKMFGEINDPVLETIISDYFVPEDKYILRIFMNNYYAYVYNFTQETCDMQLNHQVNIPNKMFKLGMFSYMKLHQKQFEKDISSGINIYTNDLK